MIAIEDFPKEPFTTADARRLGISQRGLRDAVRRSMITQVLRGVYVRTDVELDLLMTARAAALVVNDRTVVCDRSAAWLHGVDTYRFAELDDIPALEGYVIRGQDPTNRPQCRGGERDLRPEDYMELHGLRVTTPLRTAVDLACKLSRRDALAALDAFMRRHGLTHEEMQRLLVRFFRRRGVVQARELVPLADPRSESPGESWARLVILDQGFPKPTPQHWVEINGEKVFRLDLAYPHARIAVEYDGEEHHTKPEDRERDRKRRERLVAMGWTIIILDKNSFTDQAIEEWTRRLWVALARRAA